MKFKRTSGHMNKWASRSVLEPRQAKQQGFCCLVWEILSSSKMQMKVPGVVKNGGWRVRALFEVRESVKAKCELGG